MSTAVPVPDGLRLEPFRAERYSPAVVPDVAAVLSPPYDVIDEAGVRELEARSPLNVVRLILPRDDAGPGSRYAAAARLLGEWRHGGVLTRDPTPSIYVYEEAADGHVQRGLLGAVALAHPEAGIVLPHENTMAGPVADRLALTAATLANLEPIFLVYDGGGAASTAVADLDQREPIAAAQGVDGVTHRLWALTDRELLAAIGADLQPRRAVIADGHHRYATYLRYQADQHAAGVGPGPWDFGLALLVDASAFGPEVHAIHRLVPSLPPDEAVTRAAPGFRVQRYDRVHDALAASAAAAKAGPAFVVAAGDENGDTHLLTDPDPLMLAEALPAERSDAWKALDVAVAHHLLIRRLWGLADNEDVVEFRHDVDAALAGAQASGGTALLLNPTPVDAVVAVAATGDRMPRKSTLFTPKPATGLVLRPLA